jgi:hypothetical protein
MKRYVPPGIRIMPLKRASSLASVGLDTGASTTDTTLTPAQAGTKTQPAHVASDDEGQSIDENVIGTEPAAMCRRSLNNCFKLFSKSDLSSSKTTSLAASWYDRNRSVVTWQSRVCGIARIMTAADFFFQELA